MFLKETIDSVLNAIEADTEIIVVLDGYWPNQGIEQNDRVLVVHNAKPLGQRQATNQAARLSQAKYIMKLDAHCDVDKGFDRNLIEGYKDKCIDIPAQYNLHAFDWKCNTCGRRWYQGPTPTKCKYDEENDNPTCDGTDFEKIMVWKKRDSRLTTSWRFDKDLRFGYWGEYKSRKEYKDNDISPTMSCLGACWFLSREYYWELDGLDEAHGGWGQMGTELACKTWLYGGEMRCNKNTWFAHMFRTQGGDFSFPYELSGREVEHARRRSRELWIKNKWPKAKHSLKWLLAKFSPVPGWEKEKVAKPRKAVIYYTDNRLNTTFANKVRHQITRCIKDKHIVSSTIGPLDFGRNYPLDLEPSSAAMFKQILHGLRQLSDDEKIVFLCEHDVLYHPKHFDFIPEKEDVFYYNTNVWRVRSSDGFSYRVDDCRQLSGLVAHKDLLIKHFTRRLELIEKDGFSMKMGYEPGTHNRKERVDDFTSEAYEAEYPNLDIRHGENLTKSKWKPQDFRNKKYTRGWTESFFVTGWGDTRELVKDLWQT